MNVVKYSFIFFLQVYKGLELLAHNLQLKNLCCWLLSRLVKVSYVNRRPRKIKMWKLL